MTALTERQVTVPLPRFSATSLRALVVGAGVAGRALTRDLRKAPELGLEPIGFLDDDGRNTKKLHPPWLGRIDDLERVVAAEAVDVVVLAIPSLDASGFRRLADIALRSGAAVRYLPSFTAALTRDVVGSDMRTLDLHRLIGRGEVHVTSPEARTVVEGRSVLVTGAGGSIGSELCRQIHGLRPSRLIMLDHDESNLHRLELELWGEALLEDDDLVIADIRDRARIDQVFDDARPDVVFHAAAHKHLPLLEKHPCEGVKSNVLGTENLVRASIEHGVDRFILISTDKAADPTSVLGATKRLAELVVQAYQGGPTTFASVRFGNVLGSRGSLLAILTEQMASGQSVTVTHPDVTRFFMTIEEAVWLVLEAARMASAGETYVLDMGDPVRIVDLVANLAEQLHVPDVEIRFTGLRPGEKLNETLVSDGEVRMPTEHPRVFQVDTVAPAEAELPRRLRELYAMAKMNAGPEVRRMLTRLLPEYDAAALGAELVATPYPDGF